VAILFGDDEFARGEVLVKNLVSGEQIAVKKEAVVFEVTRMLGLKK
jgi:histidyl-tRNA synthetase